MSKSSTELHSLYIIDGVSREFTPAQLLDAVTDTGHALPEDCPDTIVDETLDPIVTAYAFDPGKIDEYLSGIEGAKKKLPLAFSEAYSRGRVAEALLDALWMQGRFRLGDLRLRASWKWNFYPVGTSAAFYSSVQSSADYVDALGLKFSSYSCSASSECDLTFKAELALSENGAEDIFVGQPFRSEHPEFLSKSACPSKLEPDPHSWLVYVPFETCDFRLGGSLLAQTLGFGGGVPPQVGDADYFMDCYEVVRELVEDGILLSAATVRVGGLMAALKRITSARIGIDADVSGIMSAYGENDIVRVLFAEVPGVLIQIRDIDFDYLDAELLLQDVAFFPLGHPDVENPEVRVRVSEKSGIQTILESLMQKAEGED
ncbi:MAG: hypothetical protein MJY89_07005 [Bacteroidales bacterium]|nr:hypothetical protein [Bacteroidales bacterium]